MAKVVKYTYNITITVPSGSRTIDVRDYILKVMSSGRLRVSQVKFVPRTQQGALPAAQPSKGAKVIRNTEHADL